MGFNEDLSEAEYDWSGVRITPESNEHLVGVTSKDLEESFNYEWSEIDKFLLRGKQYDPEFCEQMREYVIGKLKKVIPISIRKLNPDYVGVGFDSPEVEEEFRKNLFKQNIFYRPGTRSRLEERLRDAPNQPPRPIVLSQEAINRLYGAGPGIRVLGVYDTSTNQIYIVDNLSPEETDEVYAHEVEHWKDSSASESTIRQRVRNMGYSIFH